jgi:hypothetical protein
MWSEDGLMAQSFSLGHISITPGALAALRQQGIEPATRDGEIMLHAALPIWYGQPSQDGLLDFLDALEGETERYLTILAQVGSGNKPPTIVFSDAP